MQDWKQIRKILDNADEISVFTHINSDGDCLGSAFALAYFFAGEGKKVYIYNEEIPPENLSFIYGNELPENIKFIIYGTQEYEKNACCKALKVALALDVSDVKRLGNRKDLFQRGIVKVRIDHHISNESFAENTVCNPEWAATAEGIYEFLSEYDNFEDSPYITEIAKCIHAGILTDTGSFAYSNVTPNTHYIAAKLMELAGNMSWQYSAVFENQTQSEIKLRALAYSKIEYYKDGHIAFLFISKDEMESVGACSDDLSALAPLLRAIKDVNVGILVKPGNKIGELKLSLRSDEHCDVNKVASKFGGGGHIRAAGLVYSLDNNSSFEDFKKNLIGEVENGWNN